MSLLRPLCNALLVAALGATLLVPTTALADDDPVERVFGAERIATAVAVAQAHDSPAPDALLATSGAFPDALSAGGLAAGVDAPVLLTPQDRLPDAVLDELHRLGARQLWILGGTRAISSVVESRLRDEGFQVERLAGDDRYATARAVALATGPAPSGEVVVALGEHPQPHRAWPDAVAAGALAALPEPLPLLLTRPDEIPRDTELALHELGARRVVLVGGTAAISSGVRTRLEGLGYEVERLSGSSRYGTSVALARKAMSHAQGEALPLVLATGGNFPDALAAGALAARKGGPLLLIDPAELPEEVDQLLRERDWASTTVVGGPSAADDWVVAQVRAALRGEPRPEPAGATTYADAPESEPEPEPEPERFEGWASWYGARFAGRQTASGEIYDHHALTAAHRTLPFDTHVRVTNTRNGAEVVVRINDRGPYHGDRVIDLSERAAMELGFRDQGTTWVVIEVLDG